MVLKLKRAFKHIRHNLGGKTKFLSKILSKTSAFRQKLNDKFFFKGKVDRFICTLNQRKSTIKNGRVFLKILAGFTVGIMVISSKRVNALDDSLLTVIISEMRKQNQLRLEYNKKIFYMQKIGGYASMVSSAIQPLVPKRYKFIGRLNYLINASLNLYMLFIDFYRK